MDLIKMYKVGVVPMKKEIEELKALVEMQSRFIELLSAKVMSKEK